MVSPTILVVGATGNTGSSVVETLPKLIASGPLSDHRVLALSRSESGAEKLAKLPGVESEAINWVDISPQWLRERNVVRAFIASHNEPTQFADESTFLLAALQAGVKYVVRISTTAANVKPNSLAYYPRSHWAIEALLSSPEFEKMHWSSLQPNVFFNFYLAPAAELIKQVRATGKQHTLKLIAAEDAPVGVIDAADVGVFASHLLAEQDTSVHNKAKYVLNGPEDITGRDVVNMVEKYIGEKVKDVSYKDMSMVEHVAAVYPGAKSVVMSIQHAAETAWEGKCTVSTSSKEFLQIAPPKGTAAAALDALLQ
uniref:ARAD1B01518p n=1 Tax=Blastobotrys adeninivorans TaxID=409370 RepID=A0A060T9R9_BLAAD